MIAVCIPTYNQAAYLRKAVDSVLAQRGCEVEVWVADDHSPDETPAVMEAYARDSRVHYHRQPANLGIAGNAGWVLAQPRTEFLARLDSDDVLEPDYCVSLVAELERHPRAGVAHAAVREIDQSGRERRQRLLRRAGGYQSSEEALREGIHGYRVAANLCLFRRQALEEALPVYRPGMNFAEDWDFFLRLAVAGWGNVYVPELLGRYRVWNDVQGVRARRKHSELLGIESIFRDTLAPEWAKRGWPERELVEARRVLARAHARSLVSLHWSPEDRAQILSDLRALSPGDPVLESKIRFHLSRRGRLAARLEPLKLGAKDAVKRVLRVFR